MLCQMSGPRLLALMGLFNGATRTLSECPRSQAPFEYLSAPVVTGLPSLRRGVAGITTGLPELGRFRRTGSGTTNGRHSAFKAKQAGESPDQTASPNSSPNAVHDHDAHRPAQRDLTSFTSQDLVHALRGISPRCCPACSFSKKYNAVALSEPAADSRELALFGLPLL